jgi:hypothetical protein
MGLFDLPEALRQRIWETVLAEGRNAVPLLSTCRQILAEAQPLVLDTPITFNSQYDLVEWISTVGSLYPKRVRRLHLTIQDLEVLPASRDSGHLSWPSLSLLELYQSEAEKVVELLSRLPNLTELSLLKPESVRSYLYTDYYLAILRRVTTDLPFLNAVQFHSDEHPLSFIRTLPSLKKLSFTGYSRNSPMEALGVLSRLRHLEELEIILPSTPTVFGGLEIEMALPKTLSLTREVIRDLRGLKSFTLRERKDPQNTAPVFCTPRFIQALDSTHRPHLLKLKIDLDFTPDIPTQRAIRALCSSSNLKHVDIVWPGLRGDLLNSLPKSLVSLRTAPTFGRPPYWVLQVVQWKRANVPHLRELCLVGDPAAPLTIPVSSKLANEGSGTSTNWLAGCLNTSIQGCESSAFVVRHYYVYRALAYEHWCRTRPGRV